MKVGRILVDGDPVIYRAAFACQQSYYHVVFERDTGSMELEIFAGDPRDAIKERAQLGWWVADRWTEVIPGNFQVAKWAIDAQMHAIYRHCKEKMGGKPVMELIISGKGNYRNEIATIQGYKANRKDTPKPLFYDDAKRYLIKTWNGYVVDGREADDEVSIRMRRATEDRTPCILATIDKDLDQIPGWHYDYKNHVFYDISEEEGIQLFYAQAMSGDATDNIPGCIGLGLKKARKLVGEVVEHWDVDENLLWDLVVEEYKTRGVKDYEVTPENAEAVALEVARLVKLQEYPGQLWSPPGIADETVEGNVDD
jgi:hypothetical protein